MKGKHVVCEFWHYKGYYPKILYTLYADNYSDQIVLLTRGTHTTYYTLHREDVVHIDSATASELDTLLSQFPEPLPHMADVDHFDDPIKYDNYSLTLSGKYGEKYYSYGWSKRSFRLVDNNYRRWLSLVKQLLQILEDLTGNKNLLKLKVEDKVEALKHSFHKKGKNNKHQRWRESPQYIGSWYRLHMYNQQYFDEFTDEDLSIDDLRQLDYRHYLSSFLWLIAFQYTDDARNPKPIDAMVVFQRLSETDILSWDVDEQDALRDYFNALWDYVLTYYPPLGMDAFTFVHGVGLTGFDVTPYVKQWKSSMDDISASCHLAGYVRSLYGHYTEDGADVFDTVPKILRRWLREVSEGDYFLKRYMEYDSVRPFADEFAEASDVIILLYKAGL